MIKAAKNANIFIEPRLLSATAKAKLPIWYHVGLKGKHRIGWKSPAAICLRSNHHIITTGDMIDLLSPNHQVTPLCNSPETCKQWAQNTLTRLEDQWNPLAVQQALEYRPPEELLYVAKSLPEPSDDLKDGFRINLYNPPPRERRLFRPPDDPNPPDTLIIYTDGSARNNGNSEATAGMGIWYGKDDPRNQALRLPQNMNRNNAAELMAILYVLQNTAHKNIQQGWMGVANKNIIVAIAGWLLFREQQGTCTYLRKVEGHSGDEGNEEADKLANQGAEKETPDNINLTSPQDCRIQGLALAHASQALLYRTILDAKDTPETSQLMKSYGNRCDITASAKTYKLSYGNPCTMPIKSGPTGKVSPDLNTEECVIHVTKSRH